jgi:hypothetical protein
VPVGKLYNVCCFPNHEVFVAYPTLALPLVRASIATHET